MFEDINNAGPVNTGLEARIDDHCLKLTISYCAPEKNKYCVHYLSLNKARELKSYLEEAMVQLEEELAYVESK